MTFTPTQPDTRPADPDAASAAGDASRAPLVVEGRELLSVEKAAFILDISERHFRALVSSGELPRPIKLGRSTKWIRSDLLAAVGRMKPEHR